MPLKKALFVTTLGVMLSATAIADSCEDTALYGYMETMSSNMQSISRSVRSNDFAAARSLMPELHDAAAQAQSQTPFSLRNNTSDGQVSEFRETVQELASLFDELDAALSANDQGMAANVLNTIGQARRTGHRSFKDRSC